MTGKRSYIGGLYAYRLSFGEVCGLCTHEVVDGWGPHMGQFVRFFQGVDDTAPSDKHVILARPILNSTFVYLPGMVSNKVARRLAKVDVPDHLAATP
ncbi:unnamed protein product, partial [Ectocarpus sp. 12 AP-2014]